MANFIFSILCHSILPSFLCHLYVVDFPFSSDISRQSISSVSQSVSQSVSHAYLPFSYTSVPTHPSVTFPHPCLSASQSNTPLSQSVSQLHTLLLTHVQSSSLPSVRHIYLFHHLYKLKIYVIFFLYIFLSHTSVFFFFFLIQPSSF